jgi:acetyl-CoA acetyltransferase
LPSNPQRTACQWEQRSSSWRTRGARSPRSAASRGPRERATEPRHRDRLVDGEADVGDAELHRGQRRRDAQVPVDPRALEDQCELAESGGVASGAIPREEQDRFALRSHARAVRAIDEGRFERAGGSVTAGNASGLNDGAAAPVLMSAARAESLGVRPLARWVASGAAGVGPRAMGLGPVRATRKALERAGIAFGDVDLVELDEAFAAQTTAVMREAGERMRWGLATLCVGVGQGEATVFELAG